MNTAALSLASFQPEAKTNYRSMMGSGKTFSFSNPLPEDVDVNDIAHSLVRIPRWNGHMKHYSHWSVLHHSLMVYYLLKHFYPESPFLLEALLHDASEAYTGDMPGPLKKLIREAYKPIEHQIEKVIAIHCRAQWPWAPVIKEMDLLSQDIEGFMGFDVIIPDLNVRKGFVFEEWHKELWDHILKTGTVENYLALVTEEMDKRKNS